MESLIIPFRVLDAEIFSSKPDLKIFFILRKREFLRDTRLDKRKSSDKIRK